jgi:exodeoxyribonuclease VII large subunit
MAHKNIIKLSELNTVISDCIEASFDEAYFWVIAEISDVKNYSDRFYCFLSLIEKENQKLIAKSEAVIWRNSYHIIQKFEHETNKKFASGLQLLLQISVTYHVQFGLRLVVHNIDSSFTLGNIELEKTRILNELITEHSDVISFDGVDYHTYNKSLHVEPVIKNIALITAPDSDGQRDFLHEIRNSKINFNYEIHEFLTQMQGNQAHNSIIEQLKIIKENVIAFDIVVIARGGGSQTDLNAFDHFDLALHTASYSIPIFAGIGHERNISILDMMCYKSLKTPTKVAAYINEHNTIFASEIIDLGNEINYHSKQLLFSHHEQLTKLNDKINIAAKNLLVRQKNEIEKAKLITELVSPNKILARGFTIIRKNGKIVSNADSININDNLEIEFMNDYITSKTLSKKKK